MIILPQKPKLILPNPRGIKEAIELNKELGENKQIIVSAHHCLHEYQTQKHYEALRNVVDIDFLVEYLGSVDTVSSLFTQIEDDILDNYSGAEGKPMNFDDAFYQAMEFSSEWIDAIAPQLAPYNLDYNRDIYTATLAKAGKVVLGVDASVDLG